LGVDSDETTIFWVNVVIFGDEMGFRASYRRLLSTVLKAKFIPISIWLSMAFLGDSYLYLRTAQPVFDY